MGCVALTGKVCDEFRQNYDAHVCTRGRSTYYEQNGYRRRVHDLCSEADGVTHPRRSRQCPTSAPTPPPYVNAPGGEEADDVLHRYDGFDTMLIVVFGSIGSLLVVTSAVSWCYLKR